MLIWHSGNAELRRLLPPPTTSQRQRKMITAEGQKLADHWSRYGREHLDSYLIQDVEHRSINPQSVLLRAFVIDRLFPGQFVETIEDELLFSACACHLLQANKEGFLPELLRTLYSSEADGELPEFLSMRHRFEMADLTAELTRCIRSEYESFLSPFQAVWRQHLQGQASTAPRILELGCGSANDYRFWDSYGVATLVDYVGVDVCAANINNARARFPDVRFLIGDACCLDDGDDSCEVVLACDLLEHLSPQGIDSALAEMERLSRDEVWLSLFNASDADHHKYCESGDYYWNTLSVSKISQHLRAAGYSMEIVSVAAELEQRFPGYRHYNRKAHIVIGRQEEKANHRPAVSH